jgi:hypothetical protein
MNRNSSSVPDLERLASATISTPGSIAPGGAVQAAPDEHSSRRGLSVSGDSSKPGSGVTGGVTGDRLKPSWSEGSLVGAEWRDRVRTWGREVREA